MSRWFRAALVLLVCSSPAAAADWKPVAREELSLAAPMVDKNADAEALFWDVRITDEFSSSGMPQTVYEQYLRIKVFTDRGREMNATVDIPYMGGTRVSDVAARTLKANGRIIELNKRDVRERTIVKMSGLKMKAVSFAIPDLERGDVLEYRWKEIYYDSLATYLRLPFWREIPCVEVNYFVSPLEIPGFRMRAMAFNAQFAPPVRQKDGSSLVTLPHVPAYADAPYAPPEYEVKPWAFIYYDDAADTPTSDQFWRRFSKELHSSYDKAIKIDDGVRTAAAAAVAGGVDDQSKLRALLDLARARVRRIDVDTASSADIEKAKENKHSADTLKRGYGTGEDVTVLFVALARAAGFDARIAAVPRRDDIFFKDQYLNRYFVRGRIAAVKSGESWIFYDPANRYAPAGSLRWHHEAQLAMISGDGAPALVETPLAAPGYSVKRRAAKLRLLEDGTLEGDMQWTFSGHWSQMFKEQEDADAPADREKSLRETLQSRLPGAEITEVRIENVTAVDQPYRNSWRVRIPGFAQRTGSRLFVSPAIFQRGLGPTLSAHDRTQDVYFRFGWIEDDVVTIDLPEGYALEAPEAPAPLDAKFANYSATLGTNDAGRQLVFRRRLTVGQHKMLVFPKDQYSIIKRFFDAVDQNDARTLALRRQDTTAQ
jgi:hypothetical protein